MMFWFFLMEWIRYTSTFHFLKVLHKIVGISPSSIFLSIFNMFHVRLPGQQSGTRQTSLSLMSMLPSHSIQHYTTSTLKWQWTGTQTVSSGVEPCALSQWRKWKTRRHWGSRCESWSFPRAAGTISQVTEPNMHQLIGVLWHNKQQSLIITQH